MRDLTLFIEGMSCGHCLNAVNKALASVPGVEIGSVRIGRADVRYDESVHPARPHRRGRERRGLPRHGRRVTSAQIVVTLLGLAAVLWVNWYFFVAGRGTAVAASVGAGGMQRILVEVKGGYAPAVIRVRAGRRCGSIFIVTRPTPAPRRS